VIGTVATAAAKKLENLTAVSANAWIRITWHQRRPPLLAACRRTRVTAIAMMKTTVRLANMTVAIAVGHLLARLTAKSANARIPITSHQRHRLQNVQTRVGRAMAIATTATTTQAASMTVETAAHRL